MRVNNPFILTLIGIVLGLGLLKFTAQAERMAWIDHAFLLGVGWLVVSASLFVVRGGFFQSFAANFKKFNSWLYPAGASEVDREKESAVSRNKTHAWMPIVIAVSMMLGIFFIGLSLLLLYTV
ncbi:uncharacterized protein DUF3899 [Laceyella sediminis]|uniref:Uncharacterized protein DUF3899 n=1 Tax=Laceyella sediminis TaxID=573074 RepID=A0ABX5EN95_9BACL|nr:DUF3899 domain-containing protein [Laceyella sediminis]PRZ13923.1 uncharacterized protein DUF3899 [Laceyella sediminis]